MCQRDFAADQPNRFPRQGGDPPGFEDSHAGYDGCDDDGGGHDGWSCDLAWLQSVRTFSLWL